MFEKLLPLPQDPLLGLILKFKEDSRQSKIDLGVGVYKDARGNTPVLDCVKIAEQRILDSEVSKSYVGPAGNIQFSSAIASIVFSEEQTASLGERLSALQTPGGCGALRALAELIKRSSPAASVWVSDPTWANHEPLLGDAGLPLRTYPYYDQDTHSVRFEEMLSALTEAKCGDIVLLHACCHNPSGADLSAAQWDELIELLRARSLIPLIDVAYQGFGGSLDADVYGVRQSAARLDEFMVAVSCSKNFGLYRERVGCAFSIAREGRQARATHTHLMNIVRGIYSMPPSHGASIVATILEDDELTRQWLTELVQMRERIKAMRALISEQMNEALQSERFDFVAQQSGMFSFMGISEEQVNRLAQEYGIYMADNSRASIAGLNSTNIDYFCRSLAHVVLGAGS